MKIIVGLGNPGEKYKFTRHNIGFLVADEIYEQYAQTTWINKFGGLYCKCLFENEKFLIFKPETFMNRSGLAVRSITSFFKTNVSQLIVIHDDLDLSIGQIKVKSSGGHAGHNGLKSIHQIFGDQYLRVRIGIGRPEHQTEVSSYVLSNFSPSQMKQMNTHKKAFLTGMASLLTGNLRCFMNSFS